jgi:hypothetical protein
MNAIEDFVSSSANQSDVSEIWATEVCLASADDRAWNPSSRSPTPDSRWLAVSPVKPLFSAFSLTGFYSPQLKRLGLQYSLRPRRFLNAVVGRRPWRGANSMGIARPFVVLAAKFLGPGPTRLRLVKLAHEMGGGGVIAAASNGPAQEDTQQAVQPSKRAA